MKPKLQSDDIKFIKKTPVNRDPKRAFRLQFQALEMAKATKEGK